MAGKRVELVLSEALLAFAVHHFHQRLLVDVAQLIFGEDKVVARINVAVEFHYAGMSARTCHGTDTRLLPYPIGQGRVEQLYVISSYIFFYPFVEQTAKEVAPLFRRNGKVGQWYLAAIGQRCKMASVAVRHDAFYNRSKLDVMATNLFKEAVEFFRIIGIVVVDYSHAVPFYSVLFQEVDALHHLMEGGTSLFVFTIFIVKLLRSVDGYTYQPVVFFEELTPFVGEQCAIGLYAVVDGTPVGIFFLQLHGPFIEGKGTHQGFTTVPGEKNLWHGLRIDILLDEFFQQFFTHHMLGIFFVQLGLFQVITVVTCQIAYGSYGLQHHIERFGKRCISGHI